jgi:hypothetical protein
LFGASIAVLVVFGDRPGGITFGSTPMGPLVAMTLLGLILRRICRCPGSSGLRCLKGSPAFYGLTTP